MSLVIESIHFILLLNVKFLSSFFYNCLRKRYLAKISKLLLFIESHVTRRISHHSIFFGPVPLKISSIIKLCVAHFDNCHKFSHFSLFSLFHYCSLCLTENLNVPSLSIFLMFSSLTNVPFLLYF